MGDSRVTGVRRCALPISPRRYTKQVHLRLPTARLTPEFLEAARQLAAAHPGNCPLFLCLIRPSGAILFLETHQKYAVAPSSELQQAADKLFGEDTYYAKVDRSPPDRAQRAWQRIVTEAATN